MYVHIAMVKYTCYQTEWQIGPKIVAIWFVGETTGNLVYMTLSTLETKAEKSQHLILVTKTNIWCVKISYGKMGYKYFDYNMYNIQHKGSPHRECF